jgi:DNA polymerase III delta prime subunit
MNPKKLLWTERYRPTELSEIILPSRVMNKLSKGVQNNLLLYSSPGTGKSTTAKVLCKHNATLFVNCSLDTSVENVRTKITEFCSSLSVLDGNRQLKYVILDEFDGVSDAYMKALRGTIEQFESTARFIATCNYFNKIPDNIQSRFDCINFDFTAEEEAEIEKKYYVRIFEILKIEGMSIEKDALIELTKRKFPDMRSIINILQGFYTEGKMKITLVDIKKFHGVFKDVYEMLFDKSYDEVKSYQFLVSNYSTKVDDIIKSLGTDFIDYIQLEQPNYIRKIGEVAYEVNKHSFELKFVIDPVVCMVSLVFKLKAILNA